MDGAWTGRVWSDWMGVDFDAPDGTRYQARVENGRLGVEHDELLAGRSPVEPGWSVWAPELFVDGGLNATEGGEFRLLALRSPLGDVVTLEFHYRRGVPELLRALEVLVRHDGEAAEADPAKEQGDGDGQQREASVPAEGGPAEAGGPGDLGAEEHQGRRALQWRPGGRRKQGQEGLSGGPSAGAEAADHQTAEG